LTTVRPSAAVAAMHEVATQILFDRQTASVMESGICALRDWQVFERAFPIFDVGFDGPAHRQIRLRMVCADWNTSPPSIELCNWAGQLVNAVPHPETGRPFVCAPGAREYHRHPSHTGDLWDAYRGCSSYDLGGILTQIWHAWRKGPQ
jgi:Predicted metal binding domain